VHRAFRRRRAQLDLLINNAGVLHSGERFSKLRAANNDKASAQCTRSFLLTQALAPSLADGAKVANISSQLGSIAALGGFGTPSYAISKAAQNMATALLAQALAERGIEVIELHPGWVQTDMGGTGAQVTPAQSVAGLLALIDGATLADTGGFLDHHGQPMPW
jgi:NAD(P)-dependent dehydrogenase (short-subunit alcohol dehydrogenase family)